METAYVRPPTIDPIDLSTFDALYQQYHQAVYINIWKIIKQQQGAEDILQEVFLALWENRHKLDADKVAGWLFVTSYNKSLKHLKKYSKEKAVSFGEMPLSSEGSQEGIWQEEAYVEEWYRLRASMIEDAVNHLPERKKQVFTLCRYEGKSCDEVARIMDISPVSVKDYLKQSTRFIKDYVFAHYTEASLAVTPLLIAYLSC